MSGRAASPARRAALRVVRRVFEEGAFADQALHAEARDLEPRDRAFARALAFGTIQRRRTLDHVIGQLAGRRKLDPPVRAALQLGVFQLLLMDAVPAHAAVDETVALVRNSAATGFVNAIMRRAAGEGPEILAAIDDEATRLSYPTWLADLWRTAYGEETATALMTRLNEPPELALRANRLKTTPEELAAAVGGEVPGGDRPPEAGGGGGSPSPEVVAGGGSPSSEVVAGGGSPSSEVVAGGGSPSPQIAGSEDAVVVRGAFDAFAHPLWAEGHFMPQSRSSQAISRFVAPQPGERVLDLCAAPGGKTTHLAALMGDEGEIVSVERNADRADGLRRTCERMGVTIAAIDVADAAQPRTDGPFDRVLADPPCSGLGTLQARPDLRWRMNPDRIAGLIAEQDRILAAAAAAVRPGGVLVWSTCTLDPAENSALLHDLQRFEIRTSEILWPHETRSAGFEVSVLESTG